MKYTGFIKENTKIKEAKPLHEMIRSCSNYDFETLHKIRAYLNQGRICFSWMGYTQNPITNEFIAPDSYLTDGQWVCPNYLSYYLDKYSVSIDEDFYEHMTNSGFKIKFANESIDLMNDIESEFEEKLKHESQ